MGYFCSETLITNAGANGKTNLFPSLREIPLGIHEDGRRP